MNYDTRILNGYIKEVDHILGECAKKMQPNRQRSVRYLKKYKRELENLMVKAANTRYLSVEAAHYRPIVDTLIVKCVNAVNVAIQWLSTGDEKCEPLLTKAFQEIYAMRSTFNAEVPTHG